jgi:competence protein ComEC
MRPTIVFSLAVALSAVLIAQTRTAKTLEIYVIDVEGGNSQLYVSPSGESVLIDTGNAGAAAVRDADRIMAAIKDAGITQIDHLITTHYHGDHVGGILELAKRVPIREFIDHGTNVQPAPTIDPILQQYAALHAKVKHRVAKPGDKVAVTGLDWRIVTAAGQVITTALPGAGAPNPYCAGFKPHMR